ncbi:hypothetical protein ACFXAE_00285 [Streptomyces sp. NPDC059454]|uniref:hypothetical protein n=1 Tax=Streptomyces sp. NPDC059454 TaxID=3346836 RepID=UPI0036C039B1
MSDNAPVSVVVVDDQPAILSGVEAWYVASRRPITVVAAGNSVRTVNSCLDRVRIKYANVGRPARTKASLVARAIQDRLVDVDDL